MLEIRWLSVQEIETLVNPQLQAQGHALLNLCEAQPTCRVLGAFMGGLLIKSFTLQLYPMLGPLMSHDSGFRDSGEVVRQLATVMQEFLDSVAARGYMTVAESPVSERLCKRFGMTEVRSPVYEHVPKPGGE